MASQPELREWSFLSSVKRYEDLFGECRGFTIKKDGEVRGERIRGLVERGLMEIRPDKSIVVSEAGKAYLIANDPNKKG